MIHQCVKSFFFAFLSRRSVRFLSRLSGSLLFIVSDAAAAAHHHHHHHRLIVGNRTKDEHRGVQSETQRKILLLFRPVHSLILHTRHAVLVATLSSLPPAPPCPPRQQPPHWAGSFLAICAEIETRRFRKKKKKGPVFRVCTCVCVWLPCNTHRERG
jgi:hypothetical protein